MIKLKFESLLEGIKLEEAFNFTPEALLKTYEKCKAAKRMAGAYFFKTAVNNIGDLCYFLGKPHPAGLPVESTLIVTENALKSEGWTDKDIAIMKQMAEQRYEELTPMVLAQIQAERDAIAAEKSANRSNIMKRMWADKGDASEAKTIDSVCELCNSNDLDLFINHIKVEVPYYDDFSDYTAEEEAELKKLMDERFAVRAQEMEDLTKEAAQYGFSISFEKVAKKEAQASYYKREGTRIFTSIDKANLTDEVSERLKEIIFEARIKDKNGIGEATYDDTKKELIGKTTIFGKVILGLICDHYEHIKPGNLSDNELDQEFPALPKEEYPSDYDSELFDKAEAQITDDAEEE